MNYNPIDPLSNEEINTLNSTELESLSQLWLQKKSELENSGEYQNFIKKMQREWAIETGIIERLYTWDRGVTEILIEQGVDSTIISHQGKLSRDEANNVYHIIKDQENIIEGLFGFVKGDTVFSEHFIRQMHAEFTKHQDTVEAMTENGDLLTIELIKGTYKRQPNNPRRPDGEMHEYCPPEFVVDEMQQLVELYNKYEQSVPTVILSAWVHHRFTQIHPFQDGNGRLARALASLVFLKRGLFPIVVRDSDRKEYIGSLESADNGDLSELVKYFARRQRDSILSALGIQQQVEQAGHSKQIITNVIAKLKAKTEAHKEKINSIYDVANILQERAFLKLEALQKEIDPQLREIKTIGANRYNATVVQSKFGAAESYYYHRQIIEMAQFHGYYANVDNYKSWSRLALYTEKIFEILFSIHGHGYGDNGVMVVSGFNFEKFQHTDNCGGSDEGTVNSNHQDIFQFNYLEKIGDIEKRFDEWFEDSITIALAEWQRHIS